MRRSVQNAEDSTVETDSGRMGAFVVAPVSIQGRQCTILLDLLYLDSNHHFSFLVALLPALDTRIRVFP